MSRNYRELGNRPVVQVLTDLVRSKGSTVLFLMETKLPVQERIPIRDELGYQIMLAMLSVRRSGGLAMLWKDDVTSRYPDLLP